jgi:hypothetical protein
MSVTQIEQEAATFGQGQQILKIVSDQSPSKAQMTRILSSGILSDLVAAGPEQLRSEEVRNQIALLLGAVPCKVYEASIHNRFEGTTFSLEVDYQTSILDLAAIGQIDPSVLEFLADCSYPEMAGPPKALYSLLIFRRKMPLEWVLKFLEQGGYVPANIRELIAFAKSERITYFPTKILALNSPISEEMDEGYSRPFLRWNSRRVCCELGLYHVSRPEYIDFSGRDGWILARLKKDQEQG